MHLRLIGHGASFGWALLLLALSACEQQDATREPTPVAPPTAYQVPPSPSAAPAKGLIIAHLGFLPGLIETSDKGLFIDLVKAIDEMYQEGEIEIRVYPIARAQMAVAKGKADINLPALINPAIDASALPYRFSSTPFGQVTHVLYSNINQPISAQMLSSNRPAQDPLIIEGVADFFPFPIRKTNAIEQSLNKLSLQRIDGFIWAQEEADIELKRLGLKNIHRENLGAFDDVFIVAKGARGDEMDAILTAAIEKLQKNGRLQTLYQKIHRPFNPWQPYDPSPAD